MAAVSDPSMTRVPQALLDLAPLHPPNFRSTRYTGEGLSIAFPEIHPVDQDILRSMESFLSAIVSLYSDRKSGKGAALVRVCEEQGLGELMDAVVDMGKPTVTTTDESTVRQVFHDLRGGAFASLCLWLEALGPDGAKFGGDRNVFFLARDHLKMLRNAITGLSSEGEEKVRQQLEHGVELLVDKWGDTVHRYANKVLKVTLQTSFSGSVSESCLEFAALDRILYNIVNNAARHGGGDDLSIDVFDPARDHQNLRFVFRNAISDAHKQTLETQFGQRLSDVFLGGFTTDGSGIGTRVCTDIVTRAYGLESPAEAVERGHVGATVQGHDFISWFHWPIAASDVEEPLASR